MYKKFYDRASIVLIGFVIFYSVCLMKAKLSVADSVTRYQDENEEIVNLLSVNGAKAIKDQQQAAKGNNQIYKKRQRKSIGVEKNNEVSKTKKAKYQAQKQENNQHSIEKKMKNFFHENGSDEKIIDESIYEIPRDTENKQEISNDAVKNVLLEEFITLFELQKEKPFSLSKAGELVVVIMIKNEAKVIEQTLQPYVDGGVTRLVILDTGSTDETIEKVQQFFLKNPQVEAYLFEQPFVNFEVSRNHALKCAQETFKDDCFLFMPDAEWYMQNVSGLRDFCYDHIHNSSGISYSVKIKDKTDNLNFYTQRLFKAHKGVFFQGVVHEAINIAPMMRVPEDIYILWNPSADGCDKSYIRWQRDRDLLLKELEKNPHDTRNTFYLAQTYDCLNDLENAILWYKKRCEMKGFDEEDFMAHYRLANVYARAQRYDDSILYYLKAYQMRPHRIEPLVRLAQHYLNKQEFALSFLFAAASTKVPYPVNDLLFIEKELYDYSRYDVLGCAALHVQEFQIGKDAVIEALKVHPNYQHLLNNLNSCEAVLSKLNVFLKNEDVI